MNRKIGKCSLCGHDVVVPLTWNAVVPPTPTCVGCGAVAGEANVPTIQMAPPKPRFCDTFKETSPFWNGTNTDKLLKG